MLLRSLRSSCCRSLLLGASTWLSALRLRLLGSVVDSGDGGAVSGTATGTGTGTATEDWACCKADNEDGDGSGDGSGDGDGEGLW